MEQGSSTNFFQQREVRAYSAQSSRGCLKNMKPSILHLFMISLGQFFTLQLYPEYVLIDPQSTTLESIFTDYSTSSSIWPPTLSKQTSTPPVNSFTLFPTFYFLQFIAVPPYFLTIYYFFYEPTIPITSHPYSFANCMATIPTAPAAPEITTFSPFFSRPTKQRPIYAVSPETPIKPSRW